MYRFHENALSAGYSQAIAQDIGEGTRRVVVEEAICDYHISGRVELGSEEEVIRCRDIIDEDTIQ